MNSFNMFVYLGSGAEGKALEELIKEEAKKRGFVKKNGDANVAPFITYCVKYTIKHEADALRVDTYDGEHD